MRADLESPGKAGAGIRGMRESIRQLGGTLEIKSGAGGKGAMVTVHLSSRKRLWLQRRAPRSVLARVTLNCDSRHTVRRHSAR